MDLIGAAGTAVTAADLTVKGWGVLKRWRNGDVRITHPPNRKIVNPGWVDLSGTHDLTGHKKRHGHFWLVSRSRDEYWPKGEIDLKEDKQWHESVHLNDSWGPRESVVLLVHVSEFMHEILTDYKRRAGRTNYDPVRMHPPKTHFSVVQGLILQIPAKP
jgi:hypothetical protein